MDDDDKRLCERLRFTGWGANVADTLTQWADARQEAAARIEALTEERDAARRARDRYRAEWEDERMRYATLAFDTERGEQVTSAS